ncbi:FUSC family protein [Frateuria aurantia]
MPQLIPSSWQAAARLLYPLWPEPAYRSAVTFIVKVIAAALIGLWLAMRLDLPDPSITLLTVLLVVNPQSGLVLAKSFYRAIGTVVGALATLALYALVPQERVLFLLGLSVWLGLCVAEAQRNRNFAAYAYVLAGYTACLIGLPAVDDPTQVFGRAVSRVSEVMLGILSAGFVSDGLFPKPLREIMLRELDAQYARMLNFCRHALIGDSSDKELDAAFRGFVGDAVTLESRRSSAIFESPELRAHNGTLLRLNWRFMESGTGLQRLHRWMAHLYRERAAVAADSQRGTELGIVLHRVWVRYRELAEVLPEQALPDDVHGLLQLMQRLAQMHARLPGEVVAQRAELRAVSDAAALDYDICAELLEQLLLELWRYTEAQVQLKGGSVPMLLIPPAQSDEATASHGFRHHHDNLMGLAAGLRTMLVVLVTAMVWIQTEWDSGITAMIYALMLSGLFAISPQPVAALKLVWRGFLLAVPVAVLSYSILLPQMDSFAMLGVVMAPCLGLGAWLLTRPKYAAMGAGYNIMLTSSMALTGTMHYDMAHFINTMLGNLFGVSMASLGFAVLIPASSQWQQRRMLLGLRRYAVRACTAPLEGLTAAFESGSRDQLYALLAYPALTKRQTRHVLDWAQTVHGLGRSALDLRHDLRRGHWPQELVESIVRGIDALGAWFEHPGDPERELAASLLQQAERDWVAHYPKSEDPDCIRVRSMVHLLHVMLADRGAALDHTPGHAHRV